MKLLGTIFIIFMSIVELYAEKYGTIFASANLEYVFPEMIKSFYDKYPNASIHVQYGSSGALAKDIENGSYYDIFLSADTHYPEELYKKGKALNKTKIYARGYLVLLLPKNITVENFKRKRMKILEEKYIKKIIIANKKEAPYGKAAIEALKNSHIYDKIKNKITYSLDTGLVIDNVIWKNYIGFLPKSAIFLLPNDYTKTGTSWIEIDKKLYHPILQGYVVSKSGIKNKNAMLFLQFITSKEGKRIFKKYGYDTP